MTVNQCNQQQVEELACLTAGPSEFHNSHVIPMRLTRNSGAVRRDPAVRDVASFRQLLHLLFIFIFSNKY